MKIANIELKDAGSKSEKKDIPELTTQATQGKTYPRLENYQASIPGMEDLEVGKKYIVVAVAECVRKEEVKDGKISGCLEIHSIGFKPHGSGKVSEEDVDDLGSVKDVREYQEKIKGEKGE